MRRVKRYPLLRQQAFNEETEDDCADSKPGVNTSFPVNFPENIYMIHPDLICIFNSIKPEEKSEDSDTLKKNIFIEDASTPSRPVVLGGSFIFSNSCDGYISPTLIEKYESLAGDLSSDKENVSNGEGCLDQSLTTEDVGANQDIISFTTAPPCVESAPAMAEQPTHPKKLDLVGPYISPHKKDIITFFLTDIGRQKTLEQDGAFYGTSVAIETVGETTPDCLTTEGSEMKDKSNKDIISFLTAETRVEADNNRKLSYSLSVPKPKSRADLRKPYISLNFSDIISFYNSEESLLHACSMDSNQVLHDGLERQSEDDAAPQVPKIKSLDKENIPLNNPDQFVFQNDRSAAVLSKISTSTPKPTLKRRKTPMMIHQGSVISFYSNEESFLSALEVSSVDGEDSDAHVEEIEEAFNTKEDICKSTADNVHENVNSDIKVFSNRTTEPSLKTSVREPCKSESQLKKSNSVLVVTEEFPDIISFYNPGADDTADIPVEAALEVDNSRKKIEHTAEFGMIELPQGNDEIVKMDNEVVTASDEEPFVMIDTPACGREEEEEEVNPDKFVFRNDRSDRVEQDVSPTAKESAQNPKNKQTPMMIHQGSVITFYSNESSFLTALDSPKDAEPVTAEFIEKDITSACADVAVDEIVENVISKNNFDIKVYANTVITHDTPRDSATDCSNIPPSCAVEEPSIAEETDKEDYPIEQGTANLEQEDAMRSPVVKETEIEDDEPLVHIVEMNGQNRDSDYDDDMPGLEECPDSIHESDLSENQDSLVVVEDSISEDGKPIRKLQDIENLPSIERAIDMVNAIGGTMDQNLGMSVPEPLENDYMYDDDEFERDITEEIDSLISEAEQLMMPTDPADNDALCDDLDKFFDEVHDADELLLKAEPDEVPHLQIKKVSQNGDTEISPRDSSSESAIINFITQNIDKYMENTLGVETSVSTAAPTNLVPSTENADDLVAHIDELLDVEDYPDIPGCETPEPPSPLRDTPTPQPHTPTVTRHLIRTTSFEAESESDEEYHTLFEALNKPILPPIPRVEFDDQDSQITPAKSLTALQDDIPDHPNLSSQPTNPDNPPSDPDHSSCDPDSKVLSTGLLSEIVRHPLAGSLKRSASSGDTPGYHGRSRVTSSNEGDLLDEAHLFFLQNNIGVSSREVGEEPRNRDKKPSDEKQQLSPISSLAQTLSERLTAHPGSRSGVKMVKPSDVVKIDKQLFGELQKKFSKPKEKMSSLRSKYKNRKKMANKWVPVQVVPDQVDISYDEVNPVDVEVRIPDLTERRTPIAKLFNDTSPPPAKSPSPPVRIISPHPNVFVPIESPSALHKKRFPSPKILRKVAMFEGLSLIDSRRRPVSPGPESKYLGSLENVADPEDSHDCECKTHPSKLTKQSRNWVSQDSGLYDGTLKPVSARKQTEMFQPTWRRNSPDPAEERPRSTSPYCQSFSEAAFGVNGSYIDNHVPVSVRHPSRARNLSSDSNRENRIVQNSIGSQTNTHVDRLARSGSAASLAVVMASTFPNGGDPNFDLAGTAAKISQVCKSLSSSQTDISSCGVNLTRSRSMNSGMDVIHSTEVKRPTRPIFFDRNYSPSSAMRIRTTPENRVGQPIKAKKATASYREILKIQEKIKDADVISYQDLVRCPRNKLPPHVDKLQLQKYLSDTEFVDVFKMPREEFDKMAPWKQANLKKNVSLY